MAFFESLRHKAPRACPMTLTPSSLGRRLATPEAFGAPENQNPLMKNVSAVRGVVRSDTRNLGRRTCARRALLQLGGFARSNPPVQTDNQCGHKGLSEASLITGNMQVRLLQAESFLKA